MQSYKILIKVPNFLIVVLIFFKNVLFFFENWFIFIIFVHQNKK